MRCQAGYPADDATTGASRTRGRARGRNHVALAPPAPPPPPVLPRLSRLSRLGDAPAATARRPTPPAARRRRRAPARPSGSAPPQSRPRDRVAWRVASATAPTGLGGRVARDAPDVLGRENESTGSTRRGGDEAAPGRPAPPLVPPEEVRRSPTTRGSESSPKLPREAVSTARLFGDRRAGSQPF